MTEPNLWWEIVVHDHLMTRSHVLHLYQNPLSMWELFFKGCMIPHCQWHQHHKDVHGGSPIRAYHTSPWDLFSPQIPPMLHFLHHIAQTSGLLNCNLKGCRTFSYSCPYSKLAAFQVTRKVYGRYCKLQSWTICLCNPKRPTGHCASFFMEGVVTCNDLFLLWRGCQEISQTNGFLYI